MMPPPGEKRNPIRVPPSPSTRVRRVLGVFQWYSTTDDAPSRCTYPYPHVPSDPAVYATPTLCPATNNPHGPWTNTDAPFPQYRHRR